MKYSFEHNLIPPRLRIAIRFDCRHRSCCWRFASETERKCCHCADALRDRHPGPIRGDLCMSRLLSLRLLWSHSNVSLDDPDHRSRVSAFRSIERDCRLSARDRGWISHAHFALNQPGQSPRTFRLHRAARYRSARARPTATLECAADPGRDWNGADANCLGRRVLCSGEIFCRQQGPYLYGSVCWVSGAIPGRDRVGKAHR